MAETDKESFFSVLDESLPTQIPLLVELYINSSVIVGRERFIKIVNRNTILTEEKIKELKSKFSRFYVREDERQQFLMMLVKSNQFTDHRKTEILKDTAIQYMSRMFDGTVEVTNEVVVSAVKGCRDSIDSMLEVIQDYSINDIRELIGELSFHDFYTYDHSINVAMFSISIFRAISPEANREELTLAGLGGLLHDLGKIKISTAIINKPGKLSAEEFAEIKKHPDFGRDLLTDQICMASMADVDFNLVRRIVYEHHENFDGTGYPRGIDAKEIHLLSRVTALADFFDAITTKRSYCDVVSPGEALAIIKQAVGKKIDPKIFEVFEAQVENFVGVKEHKNRKLKDDFDPCQPHQSLPFEAVAKKTVFEATSTVMKPGRVKVSEDSLLTGPHTPKKKIG